MTVTIRPLTAADHADWHRLWTGYLTFYEASLPPEVYAATWARLLSDAPHEYRCLLAERDGAVVGLAHYLEHRHCWSVANVIYLQDLFVDPEVRGTGAGRALIEAVYATADAAGIANVYWLTQHFNANARQLYDRIGKATPFMKYTR